MPTDEIEKQHDGRTILVCSEKCFRIYRTYVYPKYGANSPTPGAAN